MVLTSEINYSDYNTDPIIMIDKLKENTYIKNLMLAADPMPGFISGSWLKLIAVITMTIDHLAACIIYGMLVWHVLPFGMSFNKLYKIYEVMRAIGRQAFPIYCFLLVEGFMHTRSRVKYLANLIVFALVSEIPFDMALQCPAELMDDPDILYLVSVYMEELMSHQNVFFTLAIGMICCWAAETVVKRYAKDKLTAFLAALLAAGFGAAGYYLANLMHTDYHGVGVLVIYVIYALHWFRIPAMGLSFAVLFQLNAEEWAWPAYVIMLFYNGKRGFIKKGAVSKYAFYLFYPVHFLLFALIRAAIIKMYA